MKPAELYRALVDARAELARGNVEACDNTLLDIMDYPWREMTGEERAEANAHVKETP
jgi:hypothetical protein